MFVDGPVASSKALSEARFPALPFAAEYLRDEFAVFLDDIGREGETRVARKWEQTTGLSFSKIGGMGVFRPDDTEATYDIL
jgi:hypothetical protein